MQHSLDAVFEIGFVRRSVIILYGFLFFSVAFIHFAQFAESYRQTAISCHRIVFDSLLLITYFIAVFSYFLKYSTKFIICCLGYDCIITLVMYCGLNKPFNSLLVIPKSINSIIPPTPQLYRA